MFFLRKRLKKSTPEEEKAFREQLQEEIEPKDTLAMIISALLMLDLPCLLVLLVICGIAMLIFL